MNRKERRRQMALQQSRTQPTRQPAAMEDAMKSKPYSNLAIGIVRPYRLRELINSLREQIPHELWERAELMIETVMNMTRGDIDNGAAGQIMVDKDFNPTGTPPPDPDGAYCMVC